MQSQYNLSKPPPKGKAYLLLLHDPDDAGQAYGAWTTQAPLRFVHSHTYYAYRDRERPLNRFLLDCKGRGIDPQITVAGVVDAEIAPAALRAMKRTKRTQDGGRR
jgi:hypothetical protein